MMTEISSFQFIEKYKPICNKRFQTFNTIIPEEHPLNKYLFDIREKTLIYEYLPKRCFFSLVKLGDINGYALLPGTKNKSIGYIITECPYRPEALEFVTFTINN